LDDKFELVVGSISNTSRQLEGKDAVFVPYGLLSPQGLGQHRANDDNGANLAYRVVLGKDPEYEHST